MVIETKIVDQLGLKLYDKVSAVVGELIANAYDADANKVLVEVPLGKALAVQKGQGVEDKGYEIKIIDDGHGMTPEEANAFYLRVGKDRRKDKKQGNKSPKGRAVMGRKGIGKLAPFGVCRTIEVRSAGGLKTKKGFEVTHFEMDYDAILSETSEEERDYHPKQLEDDGKYDSSPGTQIKLRHFLPRKVPGKETFARQISYRFLPLPDFKISIKDTKKENPEPVFDISLQNIPTAEGTRIDVDDRPIKTRDGRELKVSGWMALAKESHKNVEFAGVRIYVRGKIAAITRDFGAPAGFTGEFVARSYLVGEIRADWLDEDEDLIQTHRQDILWSSELGMAFSDWGKALLREVAKRGKQPRRDMVKKAFLSVSKLPERAKERFNDEEIEQAVIELGGKIGEFASEDELEDEDYVSGLSEIILTVAPHKLLVDTFRKIEQMAIKGKIDLTQLVKLFNTSRIAELASYGQIAEEKIKAIDLLQSLIRQAGTPEKSFQEILEDAPWLIDPKWVPLTANQTLDSFRSAFEAWYEKETGQKISTTTQIDNPTKRPDFILLHLESKLVIVEIKSPKHVFNNKDYQRLENYYDAVKKFLGLNAEYAERFPRGIKIILITDTMNLGSTEKKALKFLMDGKDGKILENPLTWEELLANTKQAHEVFLQARSAMKRRKKS